MPVHASRNLSGDHRKSLSDTNKDTQHCGIWRHRPKIIWWQHGGLRSDRSATWQQLNTWCFCPKFSCVEGQVLTSFANGSKVRDIHGNAYRNCGKGTCCFGVTASDAVVLNTSTYHAPIRNVAERKAGISLGYRHARYILMWEAFGSVWDDRHRLLLMQRLRTANLVSAGCCAKANFCTTRRQASSKLHGSQHLEKTTAEQ